METIKIKVQTNPVFEEFEIKLPCYFKSGGVRCHFWKIFSETSALHVFVGTNNDPQVEIYSPAIVLNNKDKIECTKEEFDTEAVTALHFLISKLEL